jgi:hypothetical protein
LKQEQQENAKLVEQNKTLEESGLRQQHAIDDLASRNEYMLARIAKSE